MANPRRKLSDASWLREQYETRERTPADMAVELRVAPRTVLVALWKNGIPLRPTGNQHAPLESWAKLDDKTWLRRQYVTAHRGSPDIAAELGVAAQTVLSALRQNGIPIRPQRRIPTSATEKLADAHWLNDQYVAAHRSSAEIADELGVSPGPVLAALRRHGITIRERKGRTIPAAATEKLADAHWLTDQYAARGRSSRDIATELGISPGPVLAALRRHEIPVKSPNRATPSQETRADSPAADRQQERSALSEPPGPADTVE